MLALALQERLADLGITNFDEVTLRQELEKRVKTYTLIKLADWPARRWKCHYRLMVGSSMYDAQSVSEAYTLAVLAISEQADTVESTEHTSTSPTTGAATEPHL
jgi:hypothetical protein